MLVYANQFNLRPKEGCELVIKQIASWVGEKQRSFVDPERLGRGISELKLGEGTVLSSVVTKNDPAAPSYPFLFNTRLVHPQPGVPGRRWLTEIGLRQESASDEICFSITLETEESSVRVTDPIKVTRPRIVQKMIQFCSPNAGTPGLQVIRLTEENALAFDYDIRAEARKYPLVVVSHPRDGVSLIDIEKLRQNLVGLAKVVEIAPDADTYKIEQIITRNHSAFGGAINIISPPRRRVSDVWWRTNILRPEKLYELAELNGSIETGILALITHQTNLPSKWSHTSREKVREVILRQKLKPGSHQDVAAYEELFEEMFEASKKSQIQIEALKAENEVLQANLDTVSAQNENLKTHLQKAGAAKSDQPNKLAKPSVNPLEILAGIGKLSLVNALKLIEETYPDRVFVLESAVSSARKSDKYDFRLPNEAFSLLFKLVEKYWTALSSGENDQSARLIFGTSFSAKESESLSNEGRKSRTFIFEGREYFMEKHLKIGVKDSYAETLRIHFDWLPERKIILIGHCGKHLEL